MIETTFSVGNDSSERTDATTPTAPSRQADQPDETCRHAPLTEDEAKLEYWRKIIYTQQASQQSIVVFCLERGISRHQFKHFKSILGLTKPSPRRYPQHAPQGNQPASHLRPPENSSSSGGPPAANIIDLGLLHATHPLSAATAEYSAPRAPASNHIAGCGPVTITIALGSGVSISITR